MKLKILIYILLPLLVGLASAKDYNSSLTISPKEINVNQCGIATYDLKLTNLGEKEDTFYVLVEGIPEGWYAVSHESVVLKPKESKNVYLFITANCFEEAKNYTGKVSFLGNSESMASFKMNVFADHSLSLSVPDNISSCICEEKSFIAVVENKGKYEEDVKLSAVGASLKEDRIKLKPGEKRQVELIIDKACDAKPGKYNIELTAQSTTSYAKARKVFAVNRESCYGFELSYPKEVRMCLNENVTFSIAVKNNGSKDDTFGLMIEALDIYQQATVKSGEIRMFNVNFGSNEAGMIDVAFSVKGKTKEEKGSIRFLVENCYGVDLQVDERKVDIQLGNGKMIKAKIVNTGSKEDSYKISSNINWVSIRPENVKLKGLESSDVFIYYSPQYGMKGRFETQLKAESMKSIDVENITVNVYESLPSIEPDIVENATVNESQPTGQAVKPVEGLIKNKTLIAVIAGVLLTLVVFGLIYLFVMRD